MLPQRKGPSNLLPCPRSMSLCLQAPDRDHGSVSTSALLAQRRCLVRLLNGQVLRLSSSRKPSMPLVPELTCVSVLGLPPTGHVNQSLSLPLRASVS